jgi:hypothetical protein
MKEYLSTSRKRKYCLLKIVYVLLYLLKTGCQCQMGPRDFPLFSLYVIIFLPGPSR